MEESVLQFKVTSLVVFSLLFAAACEVGSRPEDGGFPRVDSGPEAIDAATPRDSGPATDADIRLDDVLIYAHSRDTLFEFSPYSNTVTEIGQFRFSDGTPAPEMLDLAVDGAGRIFTISYMSVYVVDSSTAEVVPAMDYRADFDPVQDPIFGLSFIPPDQSPSGVELLIGATNSGELFELDLLTDRLVARGRYPGNWGSSGDITSVEGLGTFATLRQRDASGRPIDGEPDAIAQIELPATGDAIVRIIGTTRTDTGTSFTALFGLGYWGRDLYGFTRDGQLLQIDRETALTTIVSDSTGALEFYGAGVTTTVPFLI